jgi:predicted nucleic acid-binding protein
MADFFTRPVVCNTGPLIALSRAGLGGLLAQMFPRVITTSIVVQELTAKDAGDGAQIQATLATGIEIVVASIPDPLLTTELDLGEASVIQAARDLNLCVVLIDERRARRIAVEAYGLEVRGTCAVLVQAKRRGLLAKVKPALDAMIAGGYFIGPHLFAESLKQAGE